MKFKKSFIFAISMAAVCLSVFPQAVFADDIKVYLNEKQISFSSAQPSIIDGRTLVPLRGVFDACGYDIEWDADEKCAYLTKGSTVIETTESEMIMQEPNGTTPIQCDVLPKIINGSFMIPLRAVSEATGAEVDWDRDSRSVYISYKDAETSASSSVSPKGKMSVDEEEYLNALTDATNFIFKFATEKNDVALKNILFEGEPISENLIISTPADYYALVLEKINVLKDLEAPEAMSEVQDCVLNYVDVIDKAIIKAQSGSYPAEEIEKDRSSLRENSQNFGVKLYRYFQENDVSFESIYGVEILDALKRN